MLCVHMLSETLFTFAVINTISTLKAFMDQIAGISKPSGSFRKFKFLLNVINRPVVAGAVL